VSTGERDRPPRCHAVGVNAHARAVTLDGLKKSMTSLPSFSAISRNVARRWNEPRETRVDVPNGRKKSERERDCQHRARGGTCTHACERGKRREKKMAGREGAARLAALV